MVTIQPDRPTDHELTYGDPVLLSTKQLRDSPLAADGAGGVIVSTPNGNLVRIDQKGIVTKLPEQPAPAPSTDTSIRQAFLLATDVSGNRYQIQHGEKFLTKYDADGVLKAGNIGKGKLIAPSALAVDSLGNIYLIDDHRVKTLRAGDGPGSGRHSNQ